MRKPDPTAVDTAAPGAAATVNPADFLAGVALFDRVLAAAGENADAPDVWLRHDIREGRPLRVFLQPLIAELTARPELAAGFAAALGDLLVTLPVGSPDLWPQHEGVPCSAFLGPLKAAA